MKHDWSYRTLFADNPLPMWIYETATLRFLEVNDAAVRHYGYARDEFLAMGITDIRPSEDLGRLLASLKHRSPSWDDAGCWRHRLKSGGLIDVEIASHPLTFDGREAVLVVARDVTEQKKLEETLGERNQIPALMADVGVALNRRAPLGACLRSCAESLVSYLDVDLARIWTLHETRQVLDLQASAGMYTHIDGVHSRMAVGQSKIGRIARDRRPQWTNTATDDTESDDAAWVNREGMVAFAGHPLIVGDRLVGVMAVFARHPFSEAVLSALHSVADHIALGIERHLSEESSRLLAAIVEGSDDAILRMTLDGLILSWNASAERLYGYTAAEAIGQHVSLVVPLSHQRESGHLLTGVGRGEGVKHLETVRRRKDGSLIAVSLTLSPIRDATGKITGASSIARDISERQRAVDALRDVEARMRFALDASRVGIWDVDLGSGVTRWSETQEALHGVAAGTFSGTIGAFVDCVHPADRQVVRDTLEELTRKRTDARFLYRTVWPDGAVRWIRGSGRSFFADDGSPIRAAGVAQDVTEQLALEEQYRQAQRMEAVGQLAGGVAHDFNNVLTAILGYSTFLLDDLEPDHPIRHDIEEIRKAGESAASLTRQLLAFSRRQILQPEILDLNALVTQMGLLLRRLIGEDIALESRLDDGLGRISADAGQIEQIIMNLAVNARDAMRGGGTLSIETTNVELDRAFMADHPGAAAGPHVMLAVSDTGIGMDRETQMHIFEPFFTTKKRGEGTGLGLSTVFGIVKQSGGWIGVESDQGRGTTFTVYLPRVISDVGRPVDMPATRRSLAGTETILVAEDQAEVRAVARIVLERHGYTVLEACDGDEALQLMKTAGRPVHMLLTDVVMPNMGGRDLARRLCSTHPEVRVLYASGYTDDTIDRHGVLEHGVAFLQKPFTPAGLLRKVRDVLDAAHAPAI